jgi:hypothetical protein
MSQGIWVALAAGITALGAAIAQWVAKKRPSSSEGEATLGHGWSEFAAALREEAREERESRRVAEEAAAALRERVRILEKRCQDFENHLQALGIPMPPLPPETSLG